MVIIEVSEMQVLFVEDDAMNRKVVADMLGVVATRWPRRPTPRPASG